MWNFVAACLNLLRRAGHRDRGEGGGRHAVGCGSGGRNVPAADEGAAKKALCGILCIVAGILVLVCFAPNWFIAVVVSFLLMAVGALLLGFR